MSNGRLLLAFTQLNGPGLVFLRFSWSVPHSQDSCHSFQASVSRQEERGRSSTNHMAPLLSSLPFTSHLVELSHKVTAKEGRGRLAERTENQAGLSQLAAWPVGFTWGFFLLKIEPITTLNKTGTLLAKKGVERLGSNQKHLPHLPHPSHQTTGHSLEVLCMPAKSLQSCLTLCDSMAPLSMGFSRQEYWSGLTCRPPGDLPDPGIEPTSLTSPALAGDSLPLVPTIHSSRCILRPSRQLERDPSKQFLNSKAIL